MELTASGSVLILVLASALVVGTQAETSLCSQSGFRCVGRNLYQFCNAPPGSFIHSCDPGLVCSTADPSGNLCIEEPPVCVKEGAFVVNGNCMRYYLCVNNGYSLIQHIGHCAAGFEFSTSMLQCVVPEIAGCSVPLTNPSSTSTTQSSTSTEAIANDTDSTTPTNNEGNCTSNIMSSTTPSSNEKFNCPSLGIHADPSNCRNFYNCIRKQSSEILIAEKQICPWYLPHFREERNMCWLFNINC